jgi:putative salt-induced outer membrane protein YdiY
MLKADGMVRFNDHRHIGEITFFREDLADTRTKEQDLFKYSYNWLFKDPWFFSADLSLERDPIIELDSRVIVSAGIGRDIWDTPRRTLNVRLGAGFQQEKIGDIDPGTFITTDSSVATWTLRYRQDFFSDDVELFHNQTITTNITGRTNTSYRTSTGLGYEISDLLTTNITLNYDYETEPVEPAKNEDIALLFGLALEFE